jgi:hypothetical protein
MNADPDSGLGFCTSSDHPITRSPDHPISLGCRKWKPVAS